ncbi:M18 family aminopeptidase [Actinomyces sp. oral taxon 897]|uniref:M18 family aminopeptidase n=1 Tax=Actinomyces sp. oral taxon 897 TaxID=2081702 RepID=UPI000D026352|nr:M18 family aminopeptidase [Actinomyces sp. oral taxon 897]AVM61901.1 M18 family aminopeptidase [Actinomyces sp. oral taxon 897]
MSETTLAPALTVPALTSPDTYTDSLAAFVTASPSSYHAAAEVAARLEAVGLTAVSETRPWGPGLPRRGYVVRDGAVAAWILPEAPTQAAAAQGTSATPAGTPPTQGVPAGSAPADGTVPAGAAPTSSAPTQAPGASATDVAFRIVGAHTDSPALKLKPRAALNRAGWQLVNAEVYGGPLENSFLDRELGLAGRLTTRDGATHLVRTGPLARVAQVAPHLDHSVHDALRLDRQAHLLPLWSLAQDEGAELGPDAVERYLCEVAGIDFADLAGHDVLTYPTEAPARFGRRGEFLASARLDNLSSVHAALVALEALAGVPAGGGTARPGAVLPVSPRDAVVLVAFDHEEVGSETRSGAAGPFLATLLERLGAAMGYTGDAYAALLARSSCVSADAGHSVHPNYAGLHDPAVRPLVNHGPLLKINARQRYATDAPGQALWARACAAAQVPSQDFVSNNAVPCGTTIGPLTATRLGVTTVDVGVPLLSMHSQREMCGIWDGMWMSRALAAYWLGA